MSRRGGRGAPSARGSVGRGPIRMPRIFSPRRFRLPIGWHFRRRRILVDGAILLLIGGAAYKLGQSSVRDIERHTGKAADTLTEQEMEAAMSSLNIEGQDLTQKDMDTLKTEAGGDTSAPAKSTATASSATTNPSNYVEELKKLAELKEMGIVTDEEFESKKKQLLGL